MRYVVFALIVFGVLVAVLGVVAGLLKIGPHGIAVVAAGAVPVVLAAFPALNQRPFPRWAAILSLLAFLLAAIKTRAADSLQNIMLAAFAGMVVSLMLCIIPYRPERR